MSQISNQNYLLHDQYKDSSKFSARVELHRRFSTNKYGWHRWVFDHLIATPGSHILELGCGPGLLWRANRDRIPDNWHITLSDFSPGMVQEAQQHLSTSQHPFTFAVIDAQSIPNADASFDIVIANHMLYHVPDRARALSEIRRVLKPHGRFYASTVGEQHLQELDAMLARVIGSHFFWGDTSAERTRHPFTLESGTAELAQWFSHITISRHEDALVVTEAEPLLAYYLSGARRSLLVGEKQQALRTLIEQEIAAHGAIYVTKDSGLFEAYN